MTQAEKICAKVNADIKPQAITLANAVLALQRKIDEQIPIYEQMPLAQQVTVGTGERMLRQNPAVQEFRATVREYAASLKSLNDIANLSDFEPEQQKSTVLELIRAKHKKEA